MKLEVKILFLLVALFLVAHPAVLNAAMMPGDPGYKDPLIALILSLILPGLGHIYVGESSIGLIYMVVYVGVVILAGYVLFWTVLDVGLWWLVWLAAFAFAIWVAIDAMNAARAHNSRGGRLALTDGYTPAVAPVR